MSRTQMVTKVTNQKRKKHAEEIAQILRQNYADFNAVIKRIARATDFKSATVKTWCEGRKTPNLENFIRLSQIYPKLVEWFLLQVGREDLVDMIKAQNTIEDRYDFELVRLIFETENPSHILKKMQKLTLRQLWFYSGISKGHKLNPHDLIINFDISRATAYRDIDGLLQLGLICSVGEGHDKYYATLG